MTHAEVCQVCKGEGKLPPGRVTVFVSEDDTTVGRVTCLPTPCHGCDGKGWVPVGDAKEKP